MIIPSGVSFPVTLRLYNSQIPLHAIFETLGIFIGFRFFLHLKKKKGDPVESSNRVWILIAATLGALVGTRLVGAMENPAEWFRSGNRLLYAYQQKTIVGGLLGGLFVVELSKLLLKEKTSSGDLFTFPLILAMIIGRIGCFTMGVYEQTYGLPTQLPWGMDLGDSILRHPVVLYEIAFLMLLWCMLKAANKQYALANGALFKLFMMAYLLFRFALDFIKPHFTYSFGLSTIQISCLIGLIWYMRYWMKPQKLRAPIQHCGT